MNSRKHKQKENDKKRKEKEKLLQPLKEFQWVEEQMSKSE
jgi:hypothetical protein